MKKRGITIKLMSIGVFVLMGVVLALFVAAVRRAERYVEEQALIGESRRLCEMESQALADGSNYLTNEVWHFVATGEQAHLENYWNEVNQVRSRDIAIENLKALSLTPQEELLVEKAKAASDGLIEGETWAMRLVADSIGMDPSHMPQEVAAVSYRKDEGLLTAEQKRELASEYIFGPEYTSVKSEIMDNISSFRRLLMERKSAELDGAVSRTRESMRVSGRLMLALILGFSVSVLLFYCFILRPFYNYTRSLQRMGTDFTELTPMGAREIVSFAEAFNQICREWRKQKRGLEQERYRFRVALENTSLLVYEYNARTDELIAFGSLEEGPEVGKGPAMECSIPHFMREYAQKAMDGAGAAFFRRALEGRGRTSAELQMSPYPGESRRIWVRITATPVPGEDDGIVRLIGKVSNIQSEKEKEFALEDARGRDGLTGLYKCREGIRRVRKYMEDKPADQTCCLMILDMDDFGDINESEGQAFADAVLQDVADILRETAGPEDIPVRLGGDEFMLFFADCPQERAAALGPGIADEIRELSGRSGSGLRISASIGMCGTQVVDEYSGLYRCAESTLKYVKEHGKGQAASYLDTSNELGMLLTQMYPESHFISAIDREEGAYEDLSSFALDLLGKSRNLDDAIFLLLSRVGKSCGLDRILLVEVNKEYLSAQIAYQWVKNTVDAQTEEPIYLTGEQMEAVAEAYDAEGLCERRVVAVAKAGSMKSILHAAIWNYGQCVGAMSFERRDEHGWTAQERQTLSDLTKIISSFTLKARADAVSRAKTDFLSRMSHEIRTPMNAITGMTVIAKTALDDPDKMLDCLNKIEASNSYLMSLINDVLDMSRIESGRLELHEAPMRIGGLLENLDTLIRPQAEDKAQEFVIRSDVPGELQVWADELRLKQVLVNLLGNAVKFTGEGGRITLAVSRLQAGSSATLRFSVSDTGIGISREAQSRIFNAFEQAGAETASNYGGTGLGLTISSRLVQLMGGSLEVESVPGKGSSFCFDVSLRCILDGKLARGEDVEKEKPQKPFDPKGKRLLLVEDNEMNREIAQEILGMNGFEVETAENGREAVDLFRQSRPGYFDAVLMDIRMPVMGGMEAARCIRTLGKEDSRTVPIIAMTANAFDEDMKKSMENGMDGHLTKPIDVEKLMETLRRVISARRQQ